MNIPARGRYIGALLIGLVGAAQIARSPIEVILGVMFLVSAFVWAASTRFGNAYSDGVAMGVVAVVLAARALSGAVGLATTTGWSGAIIIGCTWGGGALLFGWSSWRRLRGWH